MDESAIEGIDDGMLGGIFTGQFLHSLDPKKRLTIPTEWRRIVGPSKTLFVIPNMTVQCLSVMPAHEMQEFMARIRKIGFSDAEGRQVARSIASRSQLMSWDAQGRIRVRDDLLEFAGLKEQVLLASTFNGFELWEPSRWTENENRLGPEALQDLTRKAGL